MTILLIALALMVGLALCLGASTFTGNFQMLCQGTETKGTAQLSTFTAWQLGQNSMPAINLNYTTGSAAGQINKMFVNSYSIANGAHQDLVLSNLTNDVGENVVFTAIKEIVIIINSPDGTKSLAIGPASVANSFLGGFNASTDFFTFFDHIRLTHQFAGWTVTVGTGDVFRMNNASASTLTATVILLGI